MALKESSLIFTIEEKWWPFFFNGKYQRTFLGHGLAFCMPGVTSKLKGFQAIFPVLSC